MQLPRCICKKRRLESNQDAFECALHDHVPEGVVPFKIEDLHKKIKLLSLPRTYGFETLPGLQKSMSEKVAAGEKGPTLIEQYKSGPLVDAAKGATGE